MAKTRNKKNIPKPVEDSAGFSFLKFFNSKTAVFGSIAMIYGFGFTTHKFLADQSYENKLAQNNLLNSIQLIKLEREISILTEENKKLKSYRIEDTLNIKNQKNENNKTK